MRAVSACLYAEENDPAGRGHLMMQDTEGVAGAWPRGLEMGPDAHHVGISRSGRVQQEQTRCWRIGVGVAVLGFSPYCFCPSEIEGWSSGESQGRRLMVPGARRRHRTVTWERDE